MAAESASDDGTIEVPDPDGFRQQRRMKDILEARKRVLEKRREASELYHFGEIDEETRNTILRSAVEEFIIETEGLMKDCDTNRQYFHTAQPVLDEDGDQVATDDGDPAVKYGVRLGDMQLPSGTVREFHGLESIISAENPLSDRWIEVNDGHVGGRSETVETATLQIDERVLLNAYRTVNAFLLEIGMDLDTEEDELPTFGFRELDEETIKELEEDDAPVDNRHKGDDE